MVEEHLLGATRKVLSRMDGKPYRVVKIAAEAKAEPGPEEPRAVVDIAPGRNIEVSEKVCSGMVEEDTVDPNLTAMLVRAAEGSSSPARATATAEHPGAVGSWSAVRARTGREAEDSIASIAQGKLAMVEGHIGVASPKVKLPTRLGQSWISSIGLILCSYGKQRTWALRAGGSYAVAVSRHTSRQLTREVGNMGMENSRG
jgi:hypothetical protein